MAIQRFSVEDKWTPKDWDELEIGRLNIQRQLSGEYIYADCYCTICKRKYSKSLPVEHALNENAWRLGNYLVITCEFCNNAKYKRG
jgi:hypothetical protein